MLIILAETRRQIRNWADRHIIAPQQYIAITEVSDIGQLRGLRYENEDVIRLQGFYRHPFSDRIIDEIIARAER